MCKSLTLTLSALDLSLYFVAVVALTQHSAFLPGAVLSHCLI